MRLAWVYDHKHAAAEWERRELNDWLTDVFEAPAIRLRPGVTPEIRQHVELLQTRFRRRRRNGIA